MAYHSCLCRAKAESADLEAQQVRVPIAQPHILDSIPQISVGGTLHVDSHKFYPWTRLGGQRRLAHHMLCAAAQACSGLYCGQFCPSSLPLTLLWGVWVAVLVAIWKLKKQRATYESVDHVFSLPWPLLLSWWVSLQEQCPWSRCLLIYPCQHCCSVLALTCWNVVGPWQLSSTSCICFLWLAMVSWDF